MEALRLERIIVGLVGLVVAIVVAVQAGLFIQAAFQKATAAFAAIGKQEVRR